MSRAALVIGGACILLCGALVIPSLFGARGPASGPPAAPVRVAGPPAQDRATGFGRTAPVLPPVRSPDLVPGLAKAPESAGRGPAPGGSLVARILARLPRELIETRLGLLRRERRARARFDGAVKARGIRASQLRPAVKDLFDSMALAPALDAEGMLLGLDIASLEPGSVMRGAGFRPADRITHLAGMRLRDPADLPPLLVRLGARIDVCAQREGDMLCRELILD